MSCETKCLETRTPFGRFIFYKIMTAVPVTAALVAMFRYSDTYIWPLVYIAFCLAHVNVMYISKCPHCAYYKIGGFFHRCFMMWGFPKIYKQRSGPEPAFLKVYVPVAVLTITLFPVYWLLQQWELLLIYVLSWIVLVGSIMSHCEACISFECGKNSVPEKIREMYQKEREKTV